jgi:uncharacterized protein (UPF0335 family)
VTDDASFDASPDILTSEAQGRLRTLVERIERVQEDIDSIVADQKEIYLEAKFEGYDTKVLRRVITLRKIDKAKRQELDAIEDLYMLALGEI